MSEQKPPAQVLRGSGFVLYYNEDTAPGWPCVKLVRRARVISNAGVIRSPIRLIRYEVYTDGEVRRVDEGGDWKRVPEGHREWRWASNAMKAIRAGGKLPADLVRWKVAPGTRRGEYTGAQLGAIKTGGMNG